MFTSKHPQSAAGLHVHTRQQKSFRFTRRTPEKIIHRKSMTNRAVPSPMFGSRYIRWGRQHFWLLQIFNRSRWLARPRVAELL